MFCRRAFFCFGLGSFNEAFITGDVNWSCQSGLIQFLVFFLRHFILSRVTGKEVSSVQVIEDEYECITDIFEGDSLTPDDDLDSTCDTLVASLTVSGLL